MASFPSPRLRAIFAALFRRLRDGIATAIIYFLTGVVWLCFSIFIAIAMHDGFKYMDGASPYVSRIPVYIYAPPIFALGLVCAIAWIYICRPPALPASPANAPPKPLLIRTMMACARAPGISLSAFGQFLDFPPTSARDPVMLSFHQAYRNRLPPSGSGSIVAALAIIPRIIPVFAIAVGLFLLSVAGGFSAFMLALLALFLDMLRSARSSSPLVAARGWAGSVVDRLAAEGSADLAASEASLLDKSLPLSPNPAKARRI